MTWQPIPQWQCLLAPRWGRKAATWADYNDWPNGLVEAAYKNWLAGTAPAELVFEDADLGMNHTVNFRMMLQTNRVTLSARPIRRVIVFVFVPVSPAFLGARQAP